MNCDRNECPQDEDRIEEEAGRRVKEIDTFDLWTMVLLILGLAGFMIYLWLGG